MSLVLLTTCWFLNQCVAVSFDNVQVLIVGQSVVGSFDDMQVLNQCVLDLCTMCRF